MRKSYLFRSIIQEFAGVFILGVACFISALSLQYLSSTAQLNIELETDKSGIFQVFWSGDNDGYEEKR